ncbi:MAG: hydroxymethylpyrimidine/phosphomethylpyrimidine kinase [Agarilytica sp.]
MSQPNANPPIVLSFSVLDPSGAGGIQASIETAASLGCHSAPVITAMCATGAAPNTETLATAPTLVIEQARSILDEMDVAAINVGFVGSLANAEAIHSILNDYDHIPAVSHPALCFLDEANAEHNDLIDAYNNLILPLSHIASFSLFEARKISHESDTVDTTAHVIVSSGCENIVITGTGKHTKAFQNSVFNTKGLVKNFYWEQEPANCHGSSSTLSMAMASYLAHGFEPAQAIEQAQNFTWQAMCASRDMGFGRRSPHRFYWADKNIKNSSNKPPSSTSH